MGNCSQVNNTTIKGTSAVKYDGTPLPCTDVNTCDGLDTILSKFDAIICSVKANVDVITEDVVNLTEDVMVITEDITNINNQLGICCPTTTTSTTLPPSTTTTTTTVVPTTTTTTTALTGCRCVDIVISQNDLDDATGNTITFFNNKVILYPDKAAGCGDIDIPAYYSTAGIHTYCIKADVISSITLSYVKDNIQTFVVESNLINLGTECVSDGECFPITTTTTSSSSTSTTTSTSTSTSTSTTTSTSTSTSTTTSTSSSTTTTTTTVSPPLEGCYDVTFDATVECGGDPGHAVIEYTDCSGTNQTASIPLSGTQTYCVLLGPTSLEPAFTCGNGTVTLGSECGTTTTTTTSTPTVGLSGTWDLDSVNANVEITSINNLNGQTVSCINATSCVFPIVSGSGQYIATPPTTDGTTPITSPSTASLILNLSWTSFIPGATYWFSIIVDSNPAIIQNVTYGTPVVTVSVPGIVTGAEDVTILFTGTI